MSSDRGYECDDEESNSDDYLDTESKPSYAGLVVFYNACKWTPKYSSQLVHFVVARYTTLYRVRIDWLPPVFGAYNEANEYNFNRKDSVYMYEAYEKYEGYFCEKFYSLINRTTRVSDKMFDFTIGLLVSEHIRMPFSKTICFRLATGISLFAVYAYESGYLKALDFAISAVAKSVFKLILIKTDCRDEFIVYFRERIFPPPIWSMKRKSQYRVNYSSSDSSQHASS